MGPRLEGRLALTSVRKITKILDNCMEEEKATAPVVFAGIVDRNTERRIQALELEVEAVLPLLAQKRRPFIIEFAGTPKSGKTTTLGAIHQFLKRNKVTVRTLQERASVAPLLDKGTALFKRLGDMCDAKRNNRST